MTRAPAPSWPDPAQAASQVLIALGEAGEDAPVHDLSAVAHDGDTLFLGADESAHVELLHSVEGGWGGHESVALGNYFDLPDPADELDIEGLAIDDGALWIVGSHSLARKKLKDGVEATPDSLARLAKIKECPNRAFLGCVELGDAGDGRRRLHGSGRMLAIKDGEDSLKRRLAEDPVLAPFLTIPAKENGFDIEGIAVAGARVTVGLRGPVVGGWACLIDVPLRDGGAHGLKLDSEPVKHWVDLDGLGIRDLKRAGDDLLILVGPSLAVSGPAAVYCWRGWATASIEPSVERPEMLFVLPSGYRCDHPEALVPVPSQDGERLLVLYDSPHPARLERGGIIADLFALPCTNARAGPDRTPVRASSYTPPARAAGPG